MLINNQWNRLEELKVPFDLRASVIRLYVNVIAKFKTTKEWSKDINCNIIVKQGSPSPLPLMTFTLISWKVV